MPSAVISDSQRQLTLNFDPSLVAGHRSLRDVMAAGIYQRGLKMMAAELDLSPGNLSVALSDGGQRKFDLDELERYVQVTGDKTPVYYLVARYLGDEAAARDAALGQVSDLLQSLPGMLAAAGLNTRAKARR
jgi:hypothetical protein